MKLIRCYIENFGGLHQYAVEFSDGLTVICEPNGFGKTTLAEFIRAMFYGFPRAGKDLQKNPRLKYRPWQGGRYGGYLIFEKDGKQYRIDRSFGDTPKGDKFKLYDEATSRESRDYTADIGAELFGLDSEAFLRSTYMPQNRESGPLSTDSIRAKLGNLLEDTGDMGSYEKALQRLRERRTVYEHFRGSGGSIHEHTRRMTALQKDIADCRSKEPLLEQTEAELQEAVQARTIGDAALQDVRTQLSAATTAQAEAALSREYETLTKRCTETDNRLSALRSRYPMGLPTAEELDAAAKRTDRAAALESSLQETPADRSAAETAAALASRFAQGVPSAEAFAAADEQYDAYSAARSALDNTALTEDETQQLHSLTLQFRAGMPNEDWMDDTRSMTAERNRLRSAREGMQLSEEDQMRLQALGSFFANGVPEQTELDKHEQQLERADALRRENLRLAAALPEENESSAAPVKPLHSLFLPALLAGILFAAAGIYLLTADSTALAQLPFLMHNQMLIGCITAAMAVAALIAACFLQINHNLTAKLQQNTTSGMTAAQRTLIDENEEAARSLEADTAAFASHFPFTAEAALQRRLTDIQTNRALYLPLRGRAKQLREEADRAEQQIAALTEQLTERLSPYFVSIPDFDTALQLLERRQQQYQSLLEKQAALQSKADALTDTANQLEQKLLEFLLPYCPTVQPADFRRALAELRREADSYERTRLHVLQREQALQQREQSLAALEGEATELAAKYGLVLPLLDRQALKAVERDAEAMVTLEHTAQQARTALDAFLAEHGPKPASALPEPLADPNALKLAEADLIAQQNTLRSRILRLEQQRQPLRTELDRIPALTDELTRCAEQKAADTESRRLLDETIGYLQKARESLSTSYLGGVQGHFAKYLHRLTGEQAGNIAVNTDLEVQLERAGSARPLPHFSAGQTDAVHLCMRLALSDALFEDGKCFMILDDPFVNLDDAHTAQALELLRELSEERQIVYLVCNTSRTV